MRIGAVPYLNAKPLTWRLGCEPGIELVTDVPSKLASMLASGEIAAGLVSTAACLENERLRIVPGISISCDGPAESVKLFYTGSLDCVMTVALDTSSLTSNLLAAIILRERYELVPGFVHMPPDVETMLEVCDAAVVIGDTTMRVSPGHWPCLDLGEQWKALTGLPFVFAVWAVDSTLAGDWLYEALVTSKERGLRALREISEKEAERLGLPVQLCYRYLSEIMDYDLAERHVCAIELFGEKCRRYGLTASPFSPRFSELTGVRT